MAASFASAPELQKNVCPHWPVAPWNSSFSITAVSVATGFEKKLETCSSVLA
ncbi:unannotated protein [freshwater metagenome]|uniref:Unannotated protein n=1 Tax=freshwater metagenome TaxID=449393 RepID=A0A6J6QL54_9ZZZZ